MDLRTHKPEEKTRETSPRLDNMFSSLKPKTKKTGDTQNLNTSTFDDASEILNDPAIKELFDSLNSSDDLELKPSSFDMPKKAKSAPLPTLSKEDIKSIKENSKSQRVNDNIHKDHRQRLKYQFLENGIGTLTEVQVLELLLFFAIPQRDTNPLAHKLLNEFSSIKDVLSASPEELMRVSGVKENTATLLKLVHGLINYTSLPKDANFIGSTSEAREYCANLFHGVEVEQFYVICMSKENVIKKIKMMAIGTNDEVGVQIRNITEFVILSKCNRIIICHNHPGGRARVSDQDMVFTFTLLCSCMLNSIDILDHVIVGESKTISMNEQGLLQALKDRAMKAVHIPQESKLILSASSNNFITSKPND